MAHAMRHQTAMNVASPSRSSVHFLLRQPRPGRCSVTRTKPIVASFNSPRSSIDPLSSRTVYEPGHLLTINSPEKLQEFHDNYPGKLVILMCKSSHCKPCKAFMTTYHAQAARFPDYVLLDIIGDESPATRKMMMDRKVKATPTFLLYRDGVLVETVSGTAKGRLLKALLAQLKDGERGREWDDEDEDEDENENE